MNSPVSILFVSDAPDGRSSTEQVQLLVDAAARRNDVDLTVWFLRGGPDRLAWPTNTVVDDLRRWPVSRVFSAVRLERVAGGLRGLRLRRMYAEVSPNVVVLDDGLGERIIPARYRPMIVVRRSEQPYWNEFAEPSVVRSVAMTMSPGPVFHAVPATERVDHTIRQRLGLGADTPVVVGWGPLGWVDAPDVFVRALWHMIRLGAPDVEGVWFSSSFDTELRQRLDDEVERCGLTGRVQFVDEEPPTDWRGDAVFLPRRDATSIREFTETLNLSICPVVFDVPSSPRVPARQVPYLDVRAAATELVSELESPGSALLRLADPSLEAANWLQAVVDRFGGHG